MRDRFLSPKILKSTNRFKCICLYCIGAEVDTYFNISRALSYEVFYSFQLNCVSVRCMIRICGVDNFMGPCCSCIFVMRGRTGSKNGCSWTMIMRFLPTAVNNRHRYYVLSWWMYNKITEKMLASMVFSHSTPSAATAVTPKQLAYHFK
jgi:hypothetical protein